MADLLSHEQARVDAERTRDGARRRHVGARTRLRPQIGSHAWANLDGALAIGEIDVEAGHRDEALAEQEREVFDRVGQVARMEPARESIHLEFLVEAGAQREMIVEHEHRIDARDDAPLIDAHALHAGAIEPERDAVVDATAAAKALTDALIDPVKLGAQVWIGVAIDERRDGPVFVDAL